METIIVNVRQRQMLVSNLDLQAQTFTTVTAVLLVDKHMHQITHITHVTLMMTRSSISVEKI